MVRPRHANVVPGQHIYAYCNVKTKQVLYSLTRTLQHKQLSQLPDTGANNNPPTLRKDLWRPLWSVHLPEGDDGVLQGLQAYKMLRDFRELHETTWEPPKSMSVPYTEAQIKKLEKKLDSRGGSKKENPYDLIARKKWKMRVQMVMNQKTNSIADLAAVLLKQDREVERQVERREEARRKEMREMEELAELWTKDDGAGRKALEAQIEEWKTMRGARKEDRRWRKLNGKIDAAQLKLKKMEFVAEWLDKAKLEAEQAMEARAIAREKARQEWEKARQEREQARLEAEKAKEAAAKQNPSATAATTSPAEETAIPEEEEWVEEELEDIPWSTFVPSFPQPLTRAPLTASKTSINPGDTPKRHIPPVFTPGGEGVVVRWANTMDAEYAAEWPALVRHEPMGIVRNTAPRADSDKPFFEIAEFKALGWKSRREGFAVEPGLAEKIMERRRAMGLVEHPTLKNKFTKREGLVFGEEVVEKEEEGQSVEMAGQEGDVVVKDVDGRSARREQLEELKSKVLSEMRGKSPKHALAAAMMGSDAAQLGGGRAEVRI